MSFAGNGAADKTPERYQRAYIEFILDLHHARPIDGFSWLHGLKAGRYVHVGSVDAPVTAGDITNIVMEYRSAVGKRSDSASQNSIDVLGWDFAFELNEMAKQQSALTKVNLRFLRIPRDVMDKRAVAQGDIRFFELAALDVAAYLKGRKASVKLLSFVIPPDDVPEDVRRTVRNWSQWIDYWAIDWDNKGDTFHNEWQSYRTKNNPKLELSATREYEDPGRYRAVIKVIDILGNDTTKGIDLDVH